MYWLVDFCKLNFELGDAVPVVLRYKVVCELMLRWYRQLHRCECIELNLLERAFWALDLGAVLSLKQVHNYRSIAQQVQIPVHHRLKVLWTL